MAIWNLILVMFKMINTKLYHLIIIKRNKHLIIDQLNILQLKILNVYKSIC